MKAPCSLVIGSADGDHLLLKLTSREFPDSYDYWDGNWVHTIIKVRAGAFSGRYEATLRVDEFARFRDQVSGLYETLKGAAVFETMEHQLTLRLIGDGRGHVQIKGEATDEAGGGNRLIFSLDSIDQTQLPDLLKNLASVIEAFPVRGKS